MDSAIEKSGFIVSNRALTLCKTGRSESRGPGLGVYGRRAALRSLGLTDGDIISVRRCSREEKSMHLNKAIPAAERERERERERVDWGNTES